jgi:hypothetical protein
MTLGLKPVSTCPTEAMFWHHVLFPPLSYLGGLSKFSGPDFVRYWPNAVIETHLSTCPLGGVKPTCSGHAGIFRV